jgi:hypothetical protein
MRAGASPLEAITGVIRRIMDRFQLRADHQVAMIAMSPAGQWASASLKPGFHHTVSDPQGTRVEQAQRVVMRA